MLQQALAGDCVSLGLGVLGSVQSAAPSCSVLHLRLSDLSQGPQEGYAEVTAGANSEADLPPFNPRSQDEVTASERHFRASAQGHSYCWRSLRKLQVRYAAGEAIGTT